MRTIGLAAVAAALDLSWPADAAAQAANAPVRCEVRTFDEIARRPAASSGKLFCAEVYAAWSGRTARIVERPGAARSSGDLSVFATIRTRSLLRDLSETPRRYYVEGIIRAQLPCFAAGAGECVPYRRPITLDLIRADIRP